MRLFILRQMAVVYSIILFLFFCRVNAVGETIEAASERFSVERVDEVPDFQRHVVPLLGRLGCNGRSCHGSFQGQGGLRLSLFGYDFSMDHEGLIGPAQSRATPRVNRQDAEQSLILQKPTERVSHEGGRRLEDDSWEYHLLHRWLAAGAVGVSHRRELAELRVEPEEVVVDSASEPVALRVIASWEDGYQEDVTPLCRFRSNDDSIVTVDKNGIVSPAVSVNPVVDVDAAENGRSSSLTAGDTHVIAFYDNGVAAVSVLRPIERRRNVVAVDGEDTTRIDALILAKLSKLGIQPSPTCEDSEFLRRVSVDLTGTLPHPDEVIEFLQGTAADKRRRKIDELLSRPSYAAWWANKLCDFTGCNPNQQAELGQETSVQWYGWIYSRLIENTPYNELVRRIVLARGREPGQSYREYAAMVSEYFVEDDAEGFAARETMPHYWTRRSMREPEEAAQAFAHNFLGIRLQCAQCHKHPFAQWTQDDFQQFSRFFEPIKFGVAPDTNEVYRELASAVGLSVRGNQGAAIRSENLRQARQGKVLPWRELYLETRQQPVELPLLRSQRVALDRNQDPRTPIMSWMEHPDNPWFAKAFVNRVWAAYFDVGIIDPPDDLNAANPPSHPELIAWLSEKFIEQGYDIKWLHRQILNSATYQRSWLPNETNRGDRRNFSRHIPRRMPAEVVYDAVKQALASSDKLDEIRTDLSRRAIGHLSMRLAGTYAMDVFGKPDRAINCDCERVNQPTLLQAVFLQNDPLMEQRLEESGWLEELAQFDIEGNSTNPSRWVETAWLRTLGRPPSKKELDRTVSHLQESTSLVEGMRDTLWALLNTKEFLLIK